VSQIGGVSSVFDKKRESKAAIKSSKALSEISRSSLGRFEGSTKFGDKVFKKKGVNSAGKQKWECI
jgi:hypothetical protein